LRRRAWGRLLDAEAEHLGTATVQAFETEGLIGTGAAPAVLAYLFHRIEDRLDGSPTLIIIDEGWLALDDEGFAGQLREWLKTLRKKNASVIFATQSLSDIDGRPSRPPSSRAARPALLPNERAIEPQITAIYRRFGLNDRQIEIIARAMPKRDYYCQSRRGNRLFELGLSDGAGALRRILEDRSGRHRRVTAEHGRTASSPPGCAIAASAGPPISFPTSPTRRSPMKLCRTRAARLAALLIALSRCADAGAPAHAQWSCSIRPTMRRTC
jgi:type IV secretion system protein VirB4